MGGLPRFVNGSLKLSQLNHQEEGSFILEYYARDGVTTHDRKLHTHKNTIILEIY